MAAEVPASVEAHIVDEQSVRFDGDGLMIGISRIETQDVPTAAAFLAKGYLDNSSVMQ